MYKTEQFLYISGHFEFSREGRAAPSREIMDTEGHACL